MSPHPIDDVLELVNNTLHSGNQVWIVGGLRFLPAGQAALSLGPAPDPRFGWDNVAYMTAWSQQFTAAIQKHARRGMPVPVSAGVSVNAIESVPLVVVQGWK